MVKCLKCKRHVCRKLARYYATPLNKLCQGCRKKAVEEYMADDGEEKESEKKLIEKIEKEIE